MVIDQEYKQSKSKRCIEVLVEDGKIKVWVPIIATNLFIISSNGEVRKIKEVHVRKLS